MEVLNWKKKVLTFLEKRAQLSDYA
jgi:hypothetical protein